VTCDQSPSADSDRDTLEQTIQIHQSLGLSEPDVLGERAVGARHVLRGDPQTPVRLVDLLDQRLVD